MTHFIESKLKLKVNQAKSAVDRPWKRKFLGFSFSENEQPKVRIAKQSLQKAQVKIREITSRRKPMKMEERIKELNQFLTGWCGYFSLADTPSIFRDMDKWIRRRLRMCLWKQRKLPKTKVKRLLSLGVPKNKAFEWGNTRKGYWRIAGSPILGITLDNQYWKSNGFKSLLDRTTTYGICHEPPYTERYVRWCERSGASRPLLLDSINGQDYVVIVLNIAYISNQDTGQKGVEIRCLPPLLT